MTGTDAMKLHAAWRRVQEAEGSMERANAMDKEIHLSIVEEYVSAKKELRAMEERT